MLRVAICDDDAADARRIKGYVRAYSDFDVSVYTSSKELVRDIDEGTAFDLYLLDIIMPKPDGIDLARIIRRSDMSAGIIFLTSHAGRSLDAFRVDAAKYLIKPVTRDALYRALDAAILVIKAQNAKTFLLKTKDGAHVIPFHRITYCELENRALCCVTSDGERYKGVMLRTPFDEAVSELMTDSRFIRPHFSYAVNMDYVKSVQGQSVLMKNGAVIPITHGTVREVQDKYVDYYFRRGEQE